MVCVKIKKYKKYAFWILDLKNCIVYLNKLEFLVSFAINRDHM